MMNRPGRLYLFDCFRVDVHERLLFKDNREVALTPKVFDTLLVLLENSSHVMTKKELMQQVWPDSFVEENNLAQNISARCQRYLAEMGVNLQVWVHAMETPHDKLFVFKADELKSLALITPPPASAKAAETPSNGTERTGTILRPPR